MTFKGLVAFDLDGTLVHIWSAWSWIHKLLGTLEDAKPYADRYYAGEIDYHKWAELDVRLWHGVPFDKIEEAIQSRLIFIPGAHELIETIHGWGIKTAIISSGLACFADRAKKVLRIDVSRANRLRTDSKGRICGVDVHVAYDNKHQVLIEISKEMGVPLSQCIAIGDSKNDIPMFNVAGLSIAFNATDEEVQAKASISINSENALDLLPPLQHFFNISSKQ
ncbi:MAG: HAD family hydrolase [Promethearchaeota archaeon]